MKYTLPKSYTNAGLQVNIPEDVLKQYRSEMGSTKAAVDRWLYENGYMAKNEYEAVSEASARSRKPAKREFKVDEEKSEIITFLHEQLMMYKAEADLPLLSNVEVVNCNRLIAFSLGENNYELTLARKKK